MLLSWSARAYDPASGGNSGRGSKTARIRVISPFSTWLQFTVGSGSVVEVCRSYQVSTSDPSTAISEMSMSRITFSAIPRSPAMVASAPSVVPSGPRKLTSSARMDRSRSKSRPRQASK
jgi:hypothetical protein